MRIPVRATALLLLLPVGCLGGGSDGQVHAGYLDQAVNSGRVFRWTPVQGETVDLYVELHDGPAELPASFTGRFGPATLAGWVSDAVDGWMAAAGNAYTLEVRAHSAGQKHPVSRTTIHVTFRETQVSALTGTVTMSTGAIPTLVEEACMEMQVPSNGTQIPASAYRRLIRHEFGHLLGIIAFQPGPGTGHSPDQGDLMFPVIAGEDLSLADRLTVAELYSLEPDLMRADAAGAAPDPQPTGRARVWLPGVSLLPAAASPFVETEAAPGTTLFQISCGR